MTWTYRKRKYNLTEIEYAISKGTLRAGWLPELSGDHIWVWIHLVQDDYGEVAKCYKVENCSDAEKKVLDDLLKGEIVCRMVCGWALACID